MAKRYYFYLALFLVALALRIHHAQASSKNAANVLLPFTSDGCSMFSDDRPQDSSLSWVQCCFDHDKLYWLGGTRQERKDADDALKECVRTLGHPHIAGLIEAAVRMGGWPRSPFSWRWGYGWRKPRPYSPLTSDELAQAEPYLPLLDLPMQIRKAPALSRTFGFVSAAKRKKILAEFNSRFAKSPSRIWTVELKARREMALQIFSEDCPGGYWVVRSPSRARKGALIESIESYGECSRLAVAPSNTLTNEDR